RDSDGRRHRSDCRPASHQPPTDLIDALRPAPAKLGLLQPSFLSPAIQVSLTRISMSFSGAIA
ncbi:MAG: hypothetical protein ACOVQ6_20765, partial [Brevundimonas sp.]